MPDESSDESPDEPMGGERFWQLGDLSALVGPGGAKGASAVGGTALDRLGRPEVTVDGRNLADVLRPVYRVVTAD